MPNADLKGYNQLFICGQKDLKEPPEQNVPETLQIVFGGGAELACIDLRMFMQQKPKVCIYL